MSAAGTLCVNLCCVDPNLVFLFVCELNRWIECEALWRQKILPRYYADNLYVYMCDLQDWTVHRYGEKDAVIRISDPWNERYPEDSIRSSGFTFEARCLDMKCTYELCPDCRAARGVIVNLK